MAASSTPGAIKYPQLPYRISRPKEYLRVWEDFFHRLSTRTSPNILSTSQNLLVQSITNRPKPPQYHATACTSLRFKCLPLGPHPASQSLSMNTLASTSSPRPQSARLPSQHVRYWHTSGHFVCHQHRFLTIKKAAPILTFTPSTLSSLTDAVTTKRIPKLSI